MDDTEKKEEKWQYWSARAYLETGNVEEFFLRFPESDSRRRYGGNYNAISNGFIFTIEQNSEGFFNIVKYRIKTVGES